jgi:hypothetical protein
LWVQPLGNGPRNHPLLKDLNLPPLGDISEGQSALVTKTLLFVTVWRRTRDGRVPLVPPWAPCGNPDAGRKILYVPAFLLERGDIRADRDEIIAVELCNYGLHELSPFPLA